MATAGAVATWNCRRLGKLFCQEVFRDNFANSGVGIVLLQEAQYVDDLGESWQMERSDCKRACIVYQRILSDQFLHAKRGDRWCAVVFQRFIAVSVYLPHKYIIGKAGDDFFLALCEYQRVLREVALAVQALKTTYRVKDVVLGVDAQVEVEAEVFHEQWPVTGPAVDGTSQAPRGPTGGFERLAHEYCQAFSEAITTTIGLLGLTMCNTFGGARVPTWRSTKYIPDGHKYQHVYDYICIPRAWTLPEATVVWPVPREARDRKRAEMYWSDHAIVSVPLPSCVQTETKRGRRKERGNTHWICQESALAPMQPWRPAWAPWGPMCCRVLWAMLLYELPRRLGRSHGCRIHCHV